MMATTTGVSMNNSSRPTLNNAMARPNVSNPCGRGMKVNGSMMRDEKSRDIRNQSVEAAKTVADLIRTSLGPRGMDKMIQDSKDNVIITNDGATILKELSLTHPAAKMMVETSISQDIEAGDGTTTVVVITGALLQAAGRLLSRGVHSRNIAESFYQAGQQAQEILTKMAIPVELSNADDLVKAAETSLSSKVVAQNAHFLASLAVRAVSSIVDTSTATDLDLNCVKIVKKLGGTVEDTECVNGLVFTSQKVSKVAGGPSSISNAKIGLIQFCLSPPKSDIENNIVIKVALFFWFVCFIMFVLGLSVNGQTFT
jgi:T-complex protein 1 subunit delta